MRNKWIEHFIFCSFLFLLYACSSALSPDVIIKNTIASIDTLESVSYKQQMQRTNPNGSNDTIFRYRRMCFKRLIEDSIVGVKGHWWMYGNDTLTLYYEDIYDGEKLVRIDHEDRLARVYDLEKYPSFKTYNFWGHNTPFALQYEMKFVLANTDSYILSRLSDTVILGTHCYQIQWKLEDKESMPGFWAELKDDYGNLFTTTLVIDKDTYFPIHMKSVGRHASNPAFGMLLDQQYFDLDFNFNVIDSIAFNTSQKSLQQYEVLEMHPKQY